MWKHNNNFPFSNCRFPLIVHLKIDQLKTNGKWTLENMIIFLFILLLISVFLEGTVTSLPLVLICLICMTIIFRDAVIFLPAFFVGILLDAFALRSIGGTSIFLLLVIFLILLYQRKYEINTYPFVFISSFVGSLLFLTIFGYSGAIVAAFVSGFIAVLLFMILRYSSQKFSIFNF